MGMAKGFRRFLSALAAVTVMAGAADAASEADRQTPATRGEVYLSFAPLVRKAAPAVVNIYTRKVVRTRQFAPLFDDPFFRRFFGRDFGFGDLGRPRQRVQNSLGSGVIVGAEGLIVTNHHVIEGADEITVVLADRREFEATIVGSDERTDLAILRVDIRGGDLPFLEMRDSDDLAVGDLVLAIGNPFGVGQTVTSGIVSALARTQVGISDVNSFIQTDAAINPGNSGGALVGMDGRLVGINTAIFSKSGGSLGIGFAVPSNMVRSVVAGVTRDGRLVRPWLGAWGQTMTADIAASLDMERPAGVLVSDVYPGGPAARAGVRVGDVLLSVDGREINDPESLNYRIATRVIGRPAEVVAWHKGTRKTLRIDIEPPPEEPPRDVVDLGGRHPLSGAKVANLSPALADELRLGAFSQGVIILGIRRGGSAARLGFRGGDIIVAVNGEKAKSSRQLVAILKRPADRWHIALKRGGKTHSLVIDR